MASGVRVLPLRDRESRRQLERIARDARPTALAAARKLAVAEPIGALLPDGGIRRGSVVTLAGPTGTTSVLLRLVAAATAAGEWAGVVEPDGSLGGTAAAEAGVALDRCAIVRPVPAARWAAVVAALLDGTALVAAWVPPGVRVGDARRLAARARERGSVLVAVESVPGVRTAPWPAEAALRLTVQSAPWPGLARGDGLLGARELQLRVAGRGAAREGLVGALAAAG